MRSARFISMIVLGGGGPPPPPWGGQSWALARFSRARGG